MARKYNLTDTQLRHLAIICDREQDGDAGIRACASQMCNYYENRQANKFRNVYECVFGSGWYWSKARNEKWVAEHPNVSTEVIDAVRDVICNANRTLPDYVDQYDCASDIVAIINDGVTYTDRNYIRDRSNYHKDKTIIRTVYAEDTNDYWTFYCFPDGPNGECDAFGYIYKPPEVETNMNIPDNACTIAENVATDQSHGYSQQNRWGPDFDCSSLVIFSYIRAGVPIDKTKVYYTGNMQGLKYYGFVDVTAQVDLNTGKGMLRGDILYYHISGTNGHTAMFCGNGMIVHARGQSYGSAASGDQGTEIAVTNYTRSKWQYVLRYKGAVTATAPSTAPSTPSTAHTTAKLPEIQNGSVGAAVSVLQGILDLMGYVGKNGSPLDIDGEFGANTAFALTNFQTAAGLTADGVCGSKTWAKLRNGITY